MFETVLKFLFSILIIPEVQTLLLIIIMALITWVITKWNWTKHIVSLALVAYEYAEKQGLIQNLKGYKKFDPFMDKFITDFRRKYGRDPTPKIKGKAVETMEKEVKKTQLLKL